MAVSIREGDPHAWLWGRPRINYAGCTVRRIATCVDRYFYVLVVAAAMFCVVFTTGAAHAGCIARATPAPSASPGAESQLAEDAASYAAEKEPPLYSVGTEIWSIDRDITYYQYFQGNNDGSGKVKRELRYDRNLWDTCAQLQLRLPIITKYPLAGNPYSGFGNAELRYSYSVPSPKFDHVLEVGLALPTNANGVDNTDTEIKLFYTPKWKWNGGSLAYSNEYDQTVIKPPGSTYTSYYEGKLTVPNCTFFVKGVKIAAIYNYRVLFDSGAAFKAAAGGVLFGGFNDVALNFYDTWGLGSNGLWRFKAEGSVVVRL